MYTDFSDIKEKVPSIGTSIEVLRLTRGRLHCHVSGESNPSFCKFCHRWEKRLVTDDQCFLFDHEPKAMHGFGCPLY